MRAGKKGIAATIRRGKRQIISQGFVVEAYGGEPYKRIGKGRGPIRLLTGPSVGAMVKPEMKSTEATISKRVDKEMRRGIERLWKEAARE